MAEAELVARAKAGDRAAFGELYDAYLGKIYDFALGMLRNRADAEDVTSETFLKAVERLPSLKDPDAFRGWIYSIARNCALDLIEKRKRAVPVAEHHETAGIREGLPDGPDTIFEAEEARRLVWDAAATLNPRDYEVFELTVRHGLSSAEIAAALDIRPAYAYILANRLKGSVQEGLEAVVLARTSAGDCPELERLVSGSEPGPRMRKAVTRHAKACEVCSENKRGKACVPALVAGMAFAAPSAAFAAELAARIDATWPPAPPTGGGGGGRGRLAQLAGTATVALVLGGLVVGLTPQRTLDDAERGVELESVLEEADIEPEEEEPEPVPAAPPRPAGTGGPAPAPTPQRTPTIVIIDEGGEVRTPRPRSTPVPDRDPQPQPEDPVRTPASFR